MARVYRLRHHPKDEEQARKYGIDDDKYALIRKSVTRLSESAVSQAESGDSYYANYSFSDSTTGCSGVALGGTRHNERRDRMSDGTLDGFEKLNEQQIRKIIEDSNNKLADECKKFLRQGSTMASVVITQNKIYSSWLGDSRAYLVTKNANGLVDRLRSLTPNLHNPNNPTERARLREFNEGEDYVFGKSLLGQIEVSRSLGDRLYSGLGLSSDAEMSIIDIPELKPGETAECFLMSDSLDEAFTKAKHDGTADEDTFEDFLIDRLNEGKSTEDGLVNLAQKAFEYGSTDDTTIMSIKIESNPEDRKQVKFGAVYDGHFGSDVAELARQRALPIMREESKIEAKKMSSKYFATHMKYFWEKLSRSPKKNGRTSKDRQRYSYP